MAKKSIYFCDRCAQQIGEKASRFYVITSRFTNAAGSADNEDHDVYLCGGCCCVALQKFISKMNYEQSIEWLKEFGKNGGFWTRNEGYIGKK